jgi:hypothetical protein
VRTGDGDTVGSGAAVPVEVGVGEGVVSSSRSVTDGLGDGVACPVGEGDGSGVDAGAVRWLLGVGV